MNVLGSCGLGERRIKCTWLKESLPSSCEAFQTALCPETARFFCPVTKSQLWSPGQHHCLPGVGIISLERALGNQRERTISPLTHFSWAKTSEVTVRSVGEAKAETSKADAGSRCPECRARGGTGSSGEGGQICTTPLLQDLGHTPPALPSSLLIRTSGVLQRQKQSPSKATLRPGASYHLQKAAP